MAEHYPNSRIVSVSNSSLQKNFIDSIASDRSFDNLQVITCDMNDFNIEDKFDRIVSVEMFEHMRNWEKLLTRSFDWLSEGRIPGLTIIRSLPRDFLIILSFFGVHIGIWTPELTLFVFRSLSCSLLSSKSISKFFKSTFRQ